MPRETKQRHFLPIDELRRLYLDELWNSFQIAEYFNCSAPTVLIALRAANIPVRKKGNAVRAKPRRITIAVDQIKILYLEHKWSSNRIADHFGCSKPTVLERLREAGVKLRHHNDTKRGAPSPHRHKIDEAAAVAMYLSDANPSMADVARAFRCSRTVIQRALDVRGIKRKTMAEVVTGKRSGSNNSNWRDDLTAEERASRRDNAKTVIWRTQVYERDGFACVHCGDATGGNLNAHHIEAYNSRRDLRWVVSNGVTLCTDCHRGFHKRFGLGNNTAAQFAEFRAAA